ncbi:MAG: hypothetical protein E6K52_02150 [Gammaproteobacteria bacterium]|nr:MAG: hypothetical protein E6K52_02150 [Gammaproteobacteria bacterium]
MKNSTIAGRPVSRMALLALAVGAALTLASGASAAEEGPKPITVAAPEQLRLGIALATLEAVQAPLATATTARVLDPAPLLQLDGELTAASASLAASRAEAERIAKLFAEDRTASARALEAAKAQAQADLERVNSAQRRLALEWGEGLASLSPQRRGALLNDLAHVRAELIRVEMLANTPVPTRGSIIEVRGNAGAPALRAAVLGVLPVADPRLQTRGVLSELRGAEATLPIGQMLVAQLPTEGLSASGVVLPRAALLRKGSQVWAYVQTAPTAFLRKAVTEYRPLESGWFVAKGFAAGDRVVTDGAAALLALEAQASANGTAASK